MRNQGGKGEKGERENPVLLQGIKSSIPAITLSSSDATSVRCSCAFYISYIRIQNEKILQESQWEIIEINWLFLLVSNN